MSSKILVTGATGNVGAEVVRLLCQDGQPVKVALRDCNAVNDAFSAGVERVHFDFEKPETFRPAFQDVSKLFLMRPPAVADIKQSINPALDAAKEAGVHQVVFLSIQGAEKNPVVPHAQIESYIQSIGLPYTFLRASFFMQNLSTTHRPDIKNYRELFVPAGNGKTSFIDVRDIAAVAAKTLTESGHEHQVYEPTGGKALDYYEVAHIFTQVLGKSIIYTDPSIILFAFRMHERGLDLTFILVMIAIYTTARLGLAGKVTEDTKNLLQRDPISMEKFVEDYQSCWMS
jgi:uncharacterized protein YbjT (DUF2867 family)